MYSSIAFASTCFRQSTSIFFRTEIQVYDNIYNNIVKILNSLTMVRYDH